MRLDLLELFTKRSVFKDFGNLRQRSRRRIADRPLQRGSKRVASASTGVPGRLQGGTGVQAVACRGGALSSKVEVLLMLAGTVRNIGAQRT